MRRLVATLVLSLAVVSAASAGEISARQRALLLLRVLVYDRSLAQRASGQVTVAVVFNPGGDPAERRAMEAALEELSRSVTVGGLPVRVVSLPFEGREAFAGRLAKLRPVAIFACADLGEAAPVVAEEARRARVLAVGGERRLVLEAGFVLALVDRGDRAGMVLDVEAAAAIGIEFDSALRSVAELVRGQRPVRREGG